MGIITLYKQKACTSLASPTLTVQNDIHRSPTGDRVFHRQFKHFYISRFGLDAALSMPKLSVLYSLSLDMAC